MSACIVAGGILKVLQVAGFTLAWTHSVQKTEWQEDWIATPRGLEIVEARIKGSGAGMDPPPEAKLVNGWWQWKPQRPPLPDLVLSNSRNAAAWQVCIQGQCQSLDDILGPAAGDGTVTFKAC